MHYHKTIPAVFVAGVILATAGIALAQTASPAINASDLGVSEPTLLPTSPFYFFKDLGRNIELFFTFNPVKKAELELKFADEKVIETQKVVERAPENKDALAKALANYKDMTDRLSRQLQSLHTTSQNPNVDALLQQLADRVVKHEKLFENLKDNVASDTAKSFSDAQDELGKGLLDTAGKLEASDKLVTRLQKAAAEVGTTTDRLENIQNVELFDRLESAAEDSNTKTELRKTREGFSDDVKSILEETLKSTTTDAILEELKAIPGDETLRAQIIQEIKSRSSRSDQNDLEDIQKGLEEDARGGNSLERAQEQIKSAGESISELDKKIAEMPAGQVSSTVTDMLNGANDKLVQAQKAFDDKNYGEAFGLARAAEVLARNGLRAVEKTSESDKSENDCGVKPLYPTPIGCQGPVCKDGKWKLICPSGGEGTSRGGDSIYGNEQERSGVSSGTPQQESPDSNLNRD